MEKILEHHQRLYHDRYEKNASVGDVFSGRPPPPPPKINFDGKPTIHQINDHFRQQIEQIP